MKKFEIGQQVFCITLELLVVTAWVDEVPLAVEHVSDGDPFGLDDHYRINGDDGRIWFALPVDIYATEAEAHAEAVRRAHSIVNRAELARARAMPEDKDYIATVFDETGFDIPVMFVQHGWRACTGEEAQKFHHTPADAILAVSRRKTVADALIDVDLVYLRQAVNTLTETPLTTDAEFALVQACQRLYSIVNALAEQVHELRSKESGYE